MPTAQSFENHTRWDPAMHFFVFPVVTLNFFFAIYATIHHWPDHAHLYLWWIVAAAALATLAFRCRMNDLKVQDRIISLEERLRLAAILPVPEIHHIAELDAKQLIALRFASDEELPALVHKTLTQGLEPAAIKKSITHWRPDNHRV
jgi:hypothetical protein